MNNDFGCPRHGRTFLSVYFDDLRDKLMEHCTISSCDFEREHKERRKKIIVVEVNRRNLVKNQDKKGRAK